MRPLLVVIAGPTAAGKTGFALRLAGHLHTEILSFDSRQFYREISIGTAKPTDAELAAVPHHFINSHSIFDNFNAGDFEKAALITLDELFRKHKVVIAAGGSGLYIKALLEGFDVIPQTDSQVCAEIQQIWEEFGLIAIQKLLLKHDPDYYHVVDLNNQRRITRALEVSISTGMPYSGFRNKILPERSFDVLCYCLSPDRDSLYANINARVGTMIESGLITEVQAIQTHRNLNPLRTVGYTEVFAYLDGLTDLPATIESIRQNTRRYAKRQLTWFRHQQQFTWIQPAQFDEVLAAIELRLAGGR